MPNSRHFWQGATVSWRGEIVDIHGAHNSTIMFTDDECGTMIELDRDIVPQLYQDDENYHAAVASFAVEGRLIFKNGDIVLRPVSVRRLSPWSTNEDGGFYAYMKKRRDAAAQRDGRD